VKPSWIKVVFLGCAGTPPAGAMILGRDVGSIVPVALDGTTDVEGDGATTMLGATVKEVALSVPVGLMLCGGALVAMTTAGVSVLLAEAAEPETVEPDAVVTAETEPDAVAPGMEADPDEVTRPVAEAV